MRYLKTTEEGNTLTIEASGGDRVLETLGYKSEEMAIHQERREKNREALEVLVANAPQVDKQCERVTCGKVFHVSIYRKRPKYCSKECFFKRAS